MEKLRGLDLFSGVGGLTLALAPWVEPVAYCELDRFARAVLLSRQANGQLPVAPIWDDVRTFPVAAMPDVDIVYGGFPCQDISTAGRGEGLEGKRSRLFFEVARIVRDLRPALVFLENVPAIAVRGLDRVTAEMAALGYDCRWDMLRAFDVGAPHLRERWWCLAADARGIELWLEQGRIRRSQREGAAVARYDGAQCSLADTARTRSSIDWTRGSEAEYCDASGASRWAAEPGVGRMAHGVSLRVDRLSALGNAVVPQCAREAFSRLSGLRAEGVTC